MSVVRLVFPLPQVLALAEHAIAAPGHRKSFLDHEYGTTPTPALWFVGDDGFYLMSNGVPPALDPEDPPHARVVYADGYRSSAAKHEVDALIGGDDFNEVFTLLDRRPGGQNLHTQLTAGSTAGGTHLVIEVGRVHLDLYIA